MFKVNGVRWHIAYEMPNSPNLMRSDGVYTLGVADNNVKTIFLNNRLNGSMLDRVLCHELTHVYSFENDLDIPIEVEEIIAYFMSLYGREII